MRPDGRQKKHARNLLLPCGTPLFPSVAESGIQLHNKFSTAQKYCQDEYRFLKQIWLFYYILQIKGIILAFHTFFITFLNSFSF
jgi:hypothetical protein